MNSRLTEWLQAITVFLINLAIIGGIVFLILGVCRADLT